MLLNSNIIANQFKQLAYNYNHAAALSQQVARRILDRMDIMQIKPNTILDIGAGTGICSHLLAEKYPNSHLLLTDAADTMLSIAKQNPIPSTHFSYILGDTHQLPFAANSIDMLVANLVLPWCENIKGIFQEWQRVLRPEGLLMFSCYGPDTLCELNKKHFFNDMHTIGDELLPAGFSDPVMDREYFTLRYPDKASLIQELQNNGDIYFLADVDDPFQEDIKCDLTYEIIYGHAWKVQQFETANIPLEFSIPLTKITKQL